MILTDKYSRDNYITFLRNELLPEDFSNGQEIIDPGFKSKYFKEITYLGECPSLDVNVYEIKHTSVSDARIGLSRDAFKLVSRYDKNNALIFFVPEDESNYRLSLVTIEPKLDESGSKIQYEYSNPKRYSFLLGVEAKAHTPEQYLISYGRIKDSEDLKRRFSVEVVNKEFYNQIAELFSRLVGGKRKKGNKVESFKHELELPSISFGGHEQKYKEFAVRLIGRTVFCWFLKKKKSSNNIPLIPDDVLSKTVVDSSSNFYHSVIEPLFFQILNTPIAERKNEFKSTVFDTIPFLNGGLFEPQTEDYFTNNLPNYALKIPDDWFKSFIEILDTYNFTIDENTSIDIDLSVDPEMLGRIFENLLAEINPETGETARKATGSYYTPRPIVEYMVNESLKQYLSTKTNIEENKLDALLDYSNEEPGLTNEEEQSVIKAFDTIKILDPACGSGAFPMGMLQKMLLVLQKVDREATNSIQKILNEIPDPVKRKLVEAKLKAANISDDDDLDDYARKLSIIQRSIYGVDIQPIAADISKLRFFLSLIVDEVVQDDNINRGIEPLPNLEFKFVCANTLIPLPNNEMTGGGLFEDRTNIEKLEKIREDFFISYGDEKEKLKDDFKKVQKDMWQHSLKVAGDANNATNSTTYILSSWNPFNNETTDWFDAKWMFGVESGFDITIGNPPWGAESAKKDVIKKRNKDIIVRMVDSFMFFINEALKQANSSGVMTFIVPDVILYQSDNLKLRHKIANKYKLINAINMGDNIFEEVVRASAIIQIGCQNNSDVCYVGTLKNKKDVDKKSFTKTTSEIFKNLPDNVFATENLEHYNMLTKYSTSLLELVDSDGIQRGVSPDLKEAFIINEDIVQNNKLEKIKIKKTVTGGYDVKKYLINDGEKQLIYTTRNDKIENIPNIIKYLESYRNKIKCKEVEQNKHPFYSLHRPREESIFLKDEKILGVITSDKLITAIDKNRLYPTDGVYLLSANNKSSNNYLVGFLNSSLATFFYRLLTMEKGRILAQVKPKILENLPTVIPSQTEIQVVENLVGNISKMIGDERDYLGLQYRLDLVFAKIHKLKFSEVLLIDSVYKDLITETDYENKTIAELAEYEMIED